MFALTAILFSIGVCTASSTGLADSSMQSNVIQVSSFSQVKEWNWNNGGAMLLVAVQIILYILSGCIYLGTSTFDKDADGNSTVSVPTGTAIFTTIVGVIALVVGFFLPDHEKGMASFQYWLVAVCWCLGGLFSFPEEGTTGFIFQAGGLIVAFVLAILRSCDRSR